MARRRQFLAGVAALGTAAVAGCSYLGGTSTPTAVQLGPNQASKVLSTPTPEPVEPVPATPAQSAFEASLDRADELLSRVPEPVTSDDVPNGVVREEVERARGMAADDRAGVSEQPNRFEAFELTARVRENARKAATTLAAIEDDPVADAVRDERAAARRRTRRLLESLPYEGARPLRTLFVAVEADEQLAAHERGLRDARLGGDNALHVGEFAAEVENAVAATDLWSAVVEAHRARTDEPRDFRERFADALERSVAAARDASTPAQADEVAESLTGDADKIAVRRLLQDVDHWPTAGELADHSQHGRYARGLDTALQFEHGRRTFEAVRRRVRDGDLSRVDGVDAVRSEREAAFAALDALPYAQQDPTLAGRYTYRLVNGLRWADERVRRTVENGHSVRPFELFGPYAQARARLETLPDAVETLRSRLDAA